MPPPERRGRYQVAVLWARRGSDPFGQPTVSTTPVEVRVRWDNVQTEALDKDSNSVALDATVLVAQDVEIGSVMWLGRLADLSGTTMIPLQDVMEVKLANTAKDIRGRISHRTLGLMRRGDENTFPAQA